MPTFLLYWHLSLYYPAKLHAWFNFFFYRHFFLYRSRYFTVLSKFFPNNDSQAPPPYPIHIKFQPFFASIIIKTILKTIFAPDMIIARKTKTHPVRRLNTWFSLYYIKCLDYVLQPWNKTFDLFSNQKFSAKQLSQWFRSHLYNNYTSHFPAI